MLLWSPDAWTSSRLLGHMPLQVLAFAPKGLLFIFFFKASYVFIVVLIDPRCSYSPSTWLWKSLSGAVSASKWRGIYFFPHVLVCQYVLRSSSILMHVFPSAVVMRVWWEWERDWRGGGKYTNSWSLCWASNCRREVELQEGCNTHTHTDWSRLRLTHSTT